MMDCYAVLGVQENASQDQIKAAFRERALECHPDQVDEGDEAAAREEFLRVRKAFEVLSDPQKRAAYDAADDEDADPTSADEVHVRRRSYKKAWRARQGQNVHVSRVILDKVQGLSTEYDILRNRTSVTVPVCSVLGMVFYLYEPSAIYASNIFLIDLFLCAAIGGIYGFLIGSAWGYANLVFRGRDD